MAQNFEIQTGPSLRELDLALFDRRPKVGRGNSVRRLVFVVTGRIPRWQREFDVEVTGVNVDKTEDHKFEIRGTGGFHAVSPHQKKPETGAPDGEFCIVFNTDTRKGTMTLSEGKGWKDVRITGTITIQIYLLYSTSRMIEMSLKCSSQELQERVAVVLGRILRKENFPNGVPERIGSPVGVTIGTAPGHAEEVLHVLERVLQEHEFLQGVQVMVNWSPRASELVQNVKEGTIGT